MISNPITEAELKQLIHERDQFRHWFIDERAKTTALQAEIESLRSALIKVTAKYAAARLQLMEHQ